MSEDSASDTRNADVIRRNQQLANLCTSAIDSSNINGNQPILPGGVSTRSTRRNNTVPTKDMEITLMRRMESTVSRRRF